MREFKEYGHLSESKALLISILRLTEMPNYADYMAEPIEMPFRGTDSRGTTLAPPGEYD